MEVEVTAAHRIGEVYGRNWLEMTTTQQLGGLTTQHNEIIKRVVNGSLNPITVKRALQDIIEGAVKAPSVVQQVVHQLDTWQNLGVKISKWRYNRILKQAGAFGPLTASDEPLVTGGFGYNDPKRILNELFEAFTPPIGYVGHNYLDQDNAAFRYAIGMEPSGGLRLVHYDPKTYLNLSPTNALKAAGRDHLRLAGIEGMEHLIVAPTSDLMSDVYRYTLLSGLQRNTDQLDWASVPIISRDNEYHEFQYYLHSDSNRFGSKEWWSPVVREC